MGRAPCCNKVGLHRGPWTAREDALLIKYIEAHGEGQWRSLPKKAGLLRCGKSCRLRWMNYLRPDIKRGNITPEEDDLIIRLHTLLGNRWSLIAGRLPGRTDNEIKNYWNTHLSKRLRIPQGSAPNTHKKGSEKQAINNCNKRRYKSLINNNNRTTQKLKHLKIMEDKISYVGDVMDRPKIHLPKPGRVTSVISYEINVNNTNMVNNTTTTTSATSSSSQIESLLDHGSIYDPDLIDPENIIMDLPWLLNDAHDTIVDNGFDNIMTMGLCDDYVNHEIIAPNGYINRGDLGSQDDNNKQFEKLYDEYLDLIKVDHDHGHIEEDYCDNVEVHLDSFTESFLV